MSAPGFERLLKRLDPDPERGAEEFQRLRRTLVKFFDWRGAAAPEDAADETLERLADKLEQDVAVVDLPAFAHGIARLVLHEVQRGAARHASLDGIELAAPERKGDAPEAGPMLAHLRHCLETLPREGRDLLLAYYAAGDGAGKIEGRQRLAHTWRLSGNALRSRVQRLRDRVEDCVRDRCRIGGPRENSGGDTFSGRPSPRGEGRSEMPEDAVIRRYLLGESSEGEADRVESEYFADESALDQLGAAEWDLIDDYLANRLPEASRSRFESHYLDSPAHRTRLAMARALHIQAQARATPGKNKVLYLYLLPLAAAAILVLAVLAVVWGLRMPGETRLPKMSVLTVELPLVSVRGEGETPTAVLGPGVSAVALKLEANGGGPPYAALLRTVEGREVWRGQSAQTPEFQVPAGELAAGDYVVELTSGADPAPRRYYVRFLR